MFDYEKFATKRKEKKVRIRDICKSLGKSKQTIINWSKGRTEPNEVEIRQLSDSLAVSVSEISNLSDLESDMKPIRFYCDLEGSLEHNLVEFSVMPESEKLKSMIKFRRRIGLQQSEINRMNHANKKLLDIIDSLNFCIYRKDREFRFTYVNKMFLEALQIPVENPVIGKRNSDVFRDKKFCRELDKFESETIREGVFFDNKIIYMPPLGDLKRMGMLNMKPSYDEKGNIVELTCSIIGVTDEQSPKRLLYYLEVILDSIDEGITITVLKGNIKIPIFANNAVCTMLGVEKQDFFSNPSRDSEFVIKEDEKRYRQYIESDESEFSYRIRNRDGRIAYLNCKRYKKQISDEVVLFSIIRDITKEEETSRKIRILNDTLNLIQDTAFTVVSGSDYNKFEFISRNIAKNLGVKEKYLDNLSVTDFNRQFVHPDDLHLFDRKQICNPDFPKEFIYRIIKKDGKEQKIHLKRFLTQDNALLAISQKVSSSPDDSSSTLIEKKDIAMRMKKKGISVKLIKEITGVNLQ